MSLTPEQLDEWHIDDYFDGERVDATAGEIRALLAMARECLELRERVASAEELLDRFEALHGIHWGPIDEYRAKYCVEAP